MGEYISKYSFQLRAGGLTMAEVRRIFQLEPGPPEVADVNDYIIAAVETGDLQCFTFFLHHYEKRLNSRVYRFLVCEGIDRYDPERFLDYKLSCVLAMLEALSKYDSSKGADFLTFAHYDIGNAICMTCGRVSPMKTQSSFEELAVMFEGSSTSGAERAYGKAVDKLTRKLTEAGALHAIELRRISQTKTGKKITAAVYEYLVDCDGEWGKIHFDFITGTDEIEKLADWDTTLSHIFANRAITHLLSMPVDSLPKKLLLAFDQ